MKTDSLASKAFTELRKKILSKQLPVYTRFKEDEWARKLGVSRMAVREALTRLLGEDLVMMGEKGGYYIKPILASEVHDTMQLREVMELGAIRLAVHRMSEEQIACLEKICDEYTVMAGKGYYNGAVEAEMKFHETLIEYSGNNKLLQVYRSSHIPLFTEKLGTVHKNIDDYEQTDAEHRQILHALKSKNLELAEQVLTLQFERSEAVAMAMD